MSCPTVSKSFFIPIAIKNSNAVSVLTNDIGIFAKVVIEINSVLSEPVAITASMFLTDPRIQIVAQMPAVFGQVGLIKRYNNLVFV